MAKPAARRNPHLQLTPLLLPGLACYRRGARAELLRLHCSWVPDNAHARWCTKLLDATETVRNKYTLSRYGVNVLFWSSEAKQRASCMHVCRVAYGQAVKFSVSAQTWPIELHHQTSARAYSIVSAGSRHL